jgi:toxin FitB
VSYLLDTNVISELRKGSRADHNVSSWFVGLGDDEIFLSALTLGEIRRGIESIRRRDAKTAGVLESWLGRIVDQHSARIVPIDRTIADEWGRMSTPDPLPVIDGLLAATAKVVGLTLATRNTADIERTDVSYVNPFSPR